MPKTITVLLLGLLVAVPLLWVGCGGKEQDGGHDANADSVRVTLTGDDQMKFDKTVIEVPAGAKVSLTLKHVGRMSVEAMGHNFVLLDKGTDVDVFALAAASAFKTDYIPVDQKRKVLAHTRMLGGGDSDTIVFTAPAAGTYKFICSFPGHYGSMQGDFIVR